MSSPPAARLRSFPSPPVASPESTSAHRVPAPLSLHGFECSLDTVSLDVLEAVTRTVTRAQVKDWFDRWEETEEVVLLSTCHRVELLLLARDAEVGDRWQDALPGTHDSWKVREGREVVHHLFRVAAGRESLAAGEAEVRQQVRAAGHSVLSRHPRRVLREILLSATAAAHEVAAPGSSARSIASIAATRLQSLLERPSPRVLVVGSGTVGRQVTECLAASARVTVVYHETPPQESFLRLTGANAVRLDRLAEEATTADAIVTAAKFGDHGLRAPDLPRDHPLVLVDLGMPRNIDPSVRELPNLRLVDLQELYALSKTTSAPPLPEAALDELADRCSDRVERLLWEPWVDALHRAAEAVRRAELANARAFLGDLDPEQEVAVERLTRRLVTRLLSAPTERVRSLPVGPVGELQRRLAVELLRPASPDP